MPGDHDRDRRQAGRAAWDEHELPPRREVCLPGRVGRGQHRDRVADAARHRLREASLDQRDVRLEVRAEAQRGGSERLVDRVSARPVAAFQAGERQRRRRAAACLPGDGIAERGGDGLVEGGLRVAVGDAVERDAVAADAQFEAARGGGRKGIAQRGVAQALVRDRDGRERSAQQQRAEQQRERDPPVLAETAQREGGQRSERQHASILRDGARRDATGRDWTRLARGERARAQGVRGKSWRRVRFVKRQPSAVRRHSS